MTIDQLAEKLQLPKSWIYDKTRAKQIPFIKVGKYLRFDENKINVWLHNGSPLKIETLAKRRS